MSASNYILHAHPAYIEGLYKDYSQNKASVDPEWSRFFEGFEFAITTGAGGSKSPTNQSDPSLSIELRIYKLILAYRKNAHLISSTNPIRPRRDRGAHLELADFDLSEENLEQRFAISNVVGLSNATLQEIIEKLKKIYCGSLGLEYTYMRDPEAKKWLKDKIENQPMPHFGFDLEQKKQILRKLNETTILEKFLGTKYLGEKRFSLEGGESTIPALDAIINQSADLGVEEVVIGMAHRGRLNVLATIMHKTYDQIFNEFEGSQPSGQTMGDGDVKYHLGYSSMHTTPSGKNINLKLVPNPSHLEAVNPVVEGFTRAKADVVYASDYDRILPILIHGDAAVAGQGIVYEVIQMSKLKGYATGGTIHFVINNQIGFTTDFDDARSSDYCTSVAAVVHAPVIHVNGDDVEAVVYAAQIAAEWRKIFNTDIFIDMLCYRRHGHNEADDPKFTQPRLYALIDKHKNPRDLYVEVLTLRGDIEAEMAAKMDEEFWKELQDRLDLVKQKQVPYTYQEPELAWKALRESTPEDFVSSPKTAISKDTIATIVKGLIQVPEGFQPLRKVQKMLEERRALLSEQNKLDWAGAELIAYASILLDGKNVRMSGQDVKRGTFSHRHACLYDENTGAEYNRLSDISPDQGKFLIYNSLLSEFAVLGFEFGYSLASPDHLVVWEAQFGDFTNGAQTILDQFISSSESKWQRMSGITLLLPHGYEGQGPEHSSARLERFLQMCAAYNMTVANITTPANFFHVLRRQLARPFRKPLVIMSPKSLLRHPACISSLEEIATGGFRELIDDENILAATKVSKVIFCSGKIYYDLYERKEKEKRKDIAIVRLEQLFPFPAEQVEAIFSRYKKAQFFWVQEEPANMGAWYYILNLLHKKDLALIARKPSASPATGFKKLHAKEQEEIILKALG